MSEATGVDFTAHSILRSSLQLVSRADGDSCRVLLYMDTALHHYDIVLTAYAVMLVRMASTQLSLSSLLGAII